MKYEHVLNKSPKLHCTPRDRFCSHLVGGPNFSFHSVRRQRAWVAFKWGRSRSRRHCSVYVAKEFPISRMMHIQTEIRDGRQSQWPPSPVRTGAVGRGYGHAKELCNAALASVSIFTHAIFRAAAHRWCLLRFC
ncbi:hypothetical protein GWI33_006435 [Rhynchophorus ferrugineus]|uniref:Uncharacterized protein n=1 Tax=Rhynchophorus ferrugineus TaxID=354439 RepID=A0A834IEY7_RHYFE|nr:hypothetical protein GWI33_006435 [Rhynchophorus ferrugineus]